MLKLKNYFQPINYKKHSGVQQLLLIWRKFQKSSSFFSSVSKKWTFNYSFVFFVLTSPNVPEPGLLEKIKQSFEAFVQIWPLVQWVSSLLSLIVLYAITGRYYNKWLADTGGWITVKTRCWLILLDLSLNLMLGMYYMNYRHTFMGEIMLRCPIAISPLIFVLELLAVFFYHRYIRKK